MKHHAEDNTAKDTTTKEHSSSSYDASTISIILAIDVGSSSVRCTAYDYSTTRDRNRNGNANTNTKIVTVPIHGCSLSIQRPGVEPISGAIRTNDLLDAVDCSVDEVLSKLGAKFKDQQKEFRIEAVGFSTFVMNLVAVDDTGELIVFGGNDGDDHNDENDTNPNCDDAMIIHHPAPTTSVSISYACNASEVNEECQRLRQELGQELVDALYQATGAPLHSAYALPQLRVLYKNLNPTNRQRNRKIHKWQSVAGYCLAQWTGKPHLPISYSEASWMGLLNVCDCTYEELAIGLLPPECRDALPELADFTDHLCGIPQFITEKNESGGRTNPYWEKWPELRNTKFFLGIGDGACANVGSKCTTSYRIAVTIGTSAAARMCLRQEAPSSSSSSSSSSPSLNSGDDQNDEDRSRRHEQTRHIQKRRRKNNSKGNFYFIPGQYLRSCRSSSIGNEPKAEKNIVTTQDKVITVQTVLDIGTPDIHYATSYIGVYNLLRSYGRFVKIHDDRDNRDFHETSIDGSMELNKSSLSGLGLETTITTATTRNIVPNAFPVGYNGPPLPQ
mmetsp:Transcript_24470/g.50487  ORF Transcript_24470/g.50487 Transcript_24470/m.50487 type:complete len:559 (-) Transcript_24470:106-1782(-)